MEWGIYLVGAVLAAGLGYVGGQVALLRDRRRQEEVPVAPPAEAAFRLEHLDGQTWSLVNVGRAPGALVRLVPSPTPPADGGTAGSAADGRGTPPRMPSP